MSDNRAIIVLLSVLAVVAVGLVLLELRSVLLPFAGAVLLSYLFKPVVIWMKGRGVPMPLALVVVLLLVTVMLAGLGGILYSTTSSFLIALPRYEVRLLRISEAGMVWTSQIASKWGLDLETYFAATAIDLGTITSALQAGLTSFLGIFGNGLIVLLFLMFMLAGTGNLRSKIAVAFSSDRAAKVSEITHNIDGQIKEYLLAKTLISLATGILTTAITLIIGVDFAFLWGFLAFLLNFVPTFGSIVATIFPVIIALLQFESLFVPVLVLVLLMGTQFTMGNIIEPRLMGARLNLSPLAVLFSIIFWAWLWGPWGMVMAVPITASLKIVFENIEGLRPISVLLSGKPGQTADTSYEDESEGVDSAAAVMRSASE